MKKGWSWIGMSALVCAISSCDGNEEVRVPEPQGSWRQYDILSQPPSLPEQPFNYANISLASYMSEWKNAFQDHTPDDNPITDQGATLGRVLFYDKNLSANNTISCASCHDQAHSFTDPERFSTGFEGEQTGRNSMSLFFARFYPNKAFFWDERAQTLEDQVLMPIQDHIEMGMELDTLIEKLNQVPYYPALFERAFGDPTITKDRVAKSLSQFVRSMATTNSKYDEGRAMLEPGQSPLHTDFPNFTEVENLGRSIFFLDGNCQSCHGTDAFSAPEAFNNGLDLSYEDQGVGGVTGVTWRNAHFKAPSLRNVVLTAPYMHDGRFATLKEVIDHYSEGVKLHPNLSPPLLGLDGKPDNLHLTDEEKEALISFLHTLTDSSFIQDERFSDPFNR